MYFTNKLSDISLQQLLGIFLFFFCNYNQHTVVRQMASIRRSSDGKVSKAHGILYGGWFDLVSCPHFLFEIGIYLSFWLLIPQAFTYQFMLLFVAVNQTFAGLLNHRWYVNKFKEYPKERKAIFLFIL